MIRQSFFILLVLLSAGNTCLAQFKNTNEPMDGPLRGKIDSVVVSYYNVKAGGVKELNDRNTYVYNAKGLLIEDRMSDYDEDETSGQMKTFYSYDDNGNYSQMLDYNSKGILSRKEMYKFDPIKHLVEIKSVRGITTTKLLLDERGNILEDTDYQLDTIFSITRYKYNSVGRCIESFKTWAGSPDTQKILYAYKADGNLIKENTYKTVRCLHHVLIAILNMIKDLIG